VGVNSLYITAHVLSLSPAPILPYPAAGYRLLFACCKSTSL